MLEITVVLPVYNGMRYLEKNIASVLNQSFKEFEFLITDDCSTDGSWQYLNLLSDPRIRLSRNEKNHGLFPTLNSLCKRRRAGIIKLWSQDDVMKPNCLEEVKFHHKYPQISFSYSNREHIDGEGKTLPSDDWMDKHLNTFRGLHDRIALYTGSIAGNIANVSIAKDKLK
jgi:glycosyltransferase involved in cell wall biosynthesis